MSDLFGHVPEPAPPEPPKAIRRPRVAKAKPDAEAWTWHPELPNATRRLIVDLAFAWWRPPDIAVALGMPEAGEGLRRFVRSVQAGEEPYAALDPRPGSPVPLVRRRDPADGLRFEVRQGKRVLDPLDEGLDTAIAMLADRGQECRVYVRHAPAPGKYGTGYIAFPKAAGTAAFTGAKEART